MARGAGRTIAVAALAGLLAGLAGGVIAARWLSPFAAGPEASHAPPSAPATPPVGDAAVQQQIVTAVKRVDPAVVNIDVVGPKPGTLENPWADLLPSPGQDPDRSLRGSGSGFVIDSAAGLVMTNQHVVEEARSITVTLDDGRDVPATVLGADKLSDIAILKITADKLPEARLGVDAKLEQGQWAIAIGNPFRDFPHTVTVGVISALNRSMASRDRDYRHLIQTDAAINMGNSGGPLINLDGEVIGVNAAIFSPTQVYAGLGFAIAIQDAQKIARHLTEDGGVPWLGLRMYSLDATIAADLKVETKQGVYVSGVSPDGPAERAGLRSKDIITAVAGKAIDDADLLQQKVLDGHIGDRLDLTVLRDGKTRRMTVELGARPE